MRLVRRGLNVVLMFLVFLLCGSIAWGTYRRVRAAITPLNDTSWVVNDVGRAMTFSPDGQRMAVAEGVYDARTEQYDITLRLRDPATGAVLQVFPTEQDVVNTSALVWSPDGQWIACALDQRVNVWHVEGGHVRYTLPETAPADARLGHIAWSADSTELYAVVDGVLRIWRIADGVELPPLVPAEANFYTVTFADTPRGFLVAGYDPEEFRIWRVADGKVLMRRPRDARFSWGGQRNGATGLLLSPTGETVALLEGTTIRVWKIGEDSQPLSLEGHSDEIKSVAFSPDGRFLSSGSGVAFLFPAHTGDTSVRVWQVSTGRQVAGWPITKNLVIGIAWHPTQHVLAMSEFGPTVQLRTVPFVP